MLFHCATPSLGRKGRPSRIRFEKSGESLAARARVSIRLWVFSSAKGSPPVTMRWRSYKSSSPFPLSRMRQSHGRRILLNGKGDELLNERHLIVTGGLPFAELKTRSLIDVRARAVNDSPDFSKLIREGLPLSKPGVAQ